MKLALPDGLCYGEGPDGKKVCCGAQMGRPDVLPDDPKAPVTLCMERLRFVEGGFDRWGAYWGGDGPSIWCAWNWGAPTFVFVRAASRAEAKKLMRAKLPGARFYG